MVNREKISPHHSQAINITDILRTQLHEVFSQSQFCMYFLNIIVYLMFQPHLHMEVKAEIFPTQQKGVTICLHQINYSIVNTQ